VLPTQQKLGLKMQKSKSRKNLIILQFFFLQLPLDHLLQNLAKETEKLKEMAPHLSENQDGQGTLRTLSKCLKVLLDSFYLNGHRLEFKGATSSFARLEKFTVKFQVRRL